MAAYALHAQHFILPSKMAGEGYLVVEDGKFGRFSREEARQEISSSSAMRSSLRALSTPISMASSAMQRPTATQKA
jgi:hypothetical protein